MAESRFGSVFRRRRRKTGRLISTQRPNATVERYNRLRALEIQGEETLTASGERVRHGQATYLRRLIMPWQIRAFGYYDLLGEIKSAAQFYSRSLSNLKLYAAEVDDKGELIPTEQPEVIAALDRIKDPGGTGRSGLLSSYGRLMFLTGEALLFVTHDSETDMEQWEMLSTDELRLLDGQYTRFMAPTLPAINFTEVPDDSFDVVEDKKAVAYRLWRRHPRFSALADSSMEGVLDLCEELVLLTRAVRARARSRTAGAGVLFLDNRITPTPPDPGPDDDPLGDPFIEDLTEAMTAPINDEGTAGAVVPLIARCDVPEGMRLQDLVYHLQIVDPTQLYPETGLRYECIQRIAIGLDMPAEILTGLMDANHWTAWLIDEQSWKAYLQPVAMQLVDDLTSAYLAPYLKTQGVKDWTKYRVAYDATDIINHPDRTKDAKDAHDANVIGDEALRETLGFVEEDAPTEEERNRWLGIKLRDSSVAVYGLPSLRSGTELEPTKGEIVSPDGTTAGTPGGETSAEAVKAPPQKADQAPEEAVIGSSAIVAARVVGAAQVAVLRTREAAGSRVLTKIRRDPEILALVEGTRPGNVPSVLGMGRIRALGLTEQHLTAGARDLIVESLRLFGVTDPTAVESIASAVEKHAAKTLYVLNPDPLPASFMNYVRGVLASTNGR